MQKRRPKSSRVPKAVRGSKITDHSLEIISAIARYRFLPASQLSTDEAKSLLLQTVRAKGRGGRQTPPYAFTEQGVAMLSSVLRSDRAVQVNIIIMRAFVRLREVLATHEDLARKLEELEKKVTRHDKEIKAVFEAIRSLLEPGELPKRQQIGFQVGKGRK